MTAELSWIFLTACAVGMLAATWSANRVPLAASIGVAAVLRIAFAWLTSEEFTPRDVSVYFRATGELIQQGLDPVHNLPGRQWNFLQLMPAIHALELKTGLAWVFAVKIAPIIADLVLVWLVARFAAADGRTRALQYALNPLSLLVVSLHGQVEPIALALALLGILFIKRGHPVLGGVFLGAAVAAKTWPLVILVAVLPLRNLPRLWRIVAGAAVVPVLCLLAGVLFLDTEPIGDLRHMLGYSSFVNLWTWSGTYLALGHQDLAGYDSRLGTVGTALVGVGVVVVLVFLRRHPPEVRAFGALSAVLLCSSGFGVQYLMWVLPLMMALSGPIRLGYVLAAGVWSAAFYLSPIGDAGQLLAYLRGASWLLWALILIALLQQIRSAPAVNVADRREPQDVPVPFVAEDEPAARPGYDECTQNSSCHSGAVDTYFTSCKKKAAAASTAAIRTSTLSVIGNEKRLFVGRSAYGRVTPAEIGSGDPATKPRQATGFLMRSLASIQSASTPSFQVSFLPSSRVRAL